MHAPACCPPLLCAQGRLHQRALGPHGVAPLLPGRRRGDVDLLPRMVDGARHGQGGWGALRTLSCSHVQGPTLPSLPQVLVYWVIENRLRPPKEREERVRALKHAHHAYPMPRAHTGETPKARARQADLDQIAAEAAADREWQRGGAPATPFSSKPTLSHPPACPPFVSSRGRGGCPAQPHARRPAGLAWRFQGLAAAAVGPLARHGVLHVARHGPQRRRSHARAEPPGLACWLVQGGGAVGGVSAPGRGARRRHRCRSQRRSQVCGHAGVGEPGESAGLAALLAVSAPRPMNRHFAV